MRFNFGECGESVQDEKIVLEEKRRKFVGLNAGRKEILKVTVDNCLSIQGRRCDWLLIDLAGNTGHFIELKGCDLEHAFSQLINTITIVSNTRSGFIRQKL
jgi:hypothetical protein